MILKIIIERKIAKIVFNSNKKEKKITQYKYIERNNK